MMLYSEKKSYFLDLNQRIVYYSNKLPWYLWFLVGKLLYCIGLFSSFELLRRTHVLIFLWGISVLNSLVLGLIHSPFSSEKLKRNVSLKIIYFSLLKSIYLFLLFHGLSRVGPFRTLLLTEHSHVAIYALIAAVFKGVGGPGKLRGSLWIFLGIFCLILFDNDAAYKPLHPEGTQHHEVKHFFFYFLSWTGLSDHEGGVLTLLLTTLIGASLNYYERLISIEVKGNKRFYAFSWMAVTLILTPFAFTAWVFQVSSLESPSYGQTFFSFVAIAFLFLSHYYITVSCTQRIPRITSERIGSLSAFTFAFILSLLWPSGTESSIHGLSGGAIFALVLFSTGTLHLTSIKNPKGYEALSYLEDSNLIQMNDISTGALHRSQSFFRFMATTLQAILSDRNSRTIFYFLCINLGFTFVELTFGMLTNSLGLISDGFHMLFDCSALVMGLCASVIAQWKPSRMFPYGYGRIEVLSGFVNGLFLCIISLMIFLEALERLFEPPPIKTERLLIVAVCGLLVNLGGIFAFSSSSHGHSHGGSGSSHAHKHGDHLANKEHGHSHGHSHSHNTNMQGVFLHVLADTLGSVAVIVSTLLIEWYGWLIADPICSMALSGLIMASVIPLLKDSISVLILKVPSHLEQSSREALNKILEVEGVVAYEDPYFWTHCGNTTIANLKVYSRSNFSEELIIKQVSHILHCAGYSEVSIQVNSAQDQKDVFRVAPSLIGIGTVFNAIPAEYRRTFSIRDI